MLPKMQRMTQCVISALMVLICAGSLVGHNRGEWQSRHETSAWERASHPYEFAHRFATSVFHDLFIGPSFQTTVKCNGADDSGVLAEAVKNARGGFVVVSTGETCAAGDITIPNLRIENGGLLKPLTGHTVTLSVNFEAGIYQVFSNISPGQGSITFSGNAALKEVYPEWWGGVPGTDPARQMIAFQKAIDTGARVRLSATLLSKSGYMLDNSTSPLMFNKTVTNTGVLEGGGMDTTLVTCTNATKACIQIDFPAAGAPSAVIKNFHLRGPAGPNPQFNSGNYGIYVPGYHDNVAHKISNLVIESVQIDQFGDNGVRIQGPTGPVKLSNLVVNDVGNYGIEVSFDANPKPDQSQDITIDGGSLQGQAKGGIAVTGGAAAILSLTIKDIDIELREAQTKPTLYLEQVHGAYIAGVTLASIVGSLSIGDANIYLSNGVYGCSFVGILNAAYGGLHNIHSAGVAHHNTFIGGVYLNKATSSGYLYKYDSASVNNLFINPLISEGGFARGHDSIPEDSLFKGKLPNWVTLPPDTNTKRRP